MVSGRYGDVGLPDLMTFIITTHAGDTACAGAGLVTDYPRRAPEEDFDLLRLTALLDNGDALSLALAYRLAKYRTQASAKTGDFDYAAWRPVLRRLQPTARALSDRRWKLRREAEHLFTVGLGPAVQAAALARVGDPQDLDSTRAAANAWIQDCCFR